MTGPEVCPRGVKLFHFLTFVARVSNAGDARLVIFSNGHKKTDKHPDYILYVENQKKREEEVDVPPTVPDESDVPF